MAEQNEKWFVDLCRASRLKPTRDSDGTVHVVGRGGDIYAHGPGRLAFCLFGASATSQRKGRLISNLVPAILTVEQEGDQEAVFTFAPEHLAQVARLARCRFKKVLTAETLARLTDNMAEVRGARESERLKTAPLES